MKCSECGAELDHDDSGCVSCWKENSDQFQQEFAEAEAKFFTYLSTELAGAN